MKFTHKKLVSTLSLSTLLQLTAGGNVAVAQGLDSHVHGEAELNVALVDQQLQIEFISPAMNLLGFERAPTTDEETESLNTVITELLTGGAWLLGDALSSCAASTLSFEGPQYDEAAHEHEHDDDHEHEEHDDHEHEGGHDGEGSEAHADFHVQYLYDCPSEPGREFRLTVFDNYSGIEQVTVQWIAGRQQGFAELTSTNPVLSLE